jgi:UDP-GlcNAc:undecaprenyl-phosphate GlcNAc-1-phosphate transferase
MTYLFIIIVSFMIVYLITPSIRYLALKFYAIETKNHRKIHTKKVITKLGGVAIYLGFLGGLSSIFFFDPILLRTYFSQIVGLCFCSTLILLLGIYDDFQGSNASTKLIVQTVVSCLLIKVGFRLESIFIPGIGNWPLGPLSVPFTIFWLVGVINAVNLIDGLDGLAAGVVAIGVLFLGLQGFLLGQKFVVFVALAVLGGSLAFLKYNFYPAKIFMGDSGSLFLGFVVGSISIYGAPGGRAGSPYFLLAIFVLFLPILDTILAIIRRVSRRKPIFSSDSSHIHHYCLKKGLTQIQAVVCFYVVTFILGLVCICFPFMRH